MRPRELSIRLQVLIALAIPAAALLACLAILAVSNRRPVETARWVNRGFEVRALLDQTLTLLADAETGVRGYLLTRQPSFLQPFERATMLLPDITRSLEDLAGGNSAQRNRAAALRKLTTERMSILRELSLRVSGGEEVPVEALESGKSSLDAVRRNIGSFGSAEDSLLSQRFERERRQRENVYWWLVATALLGLAGSLPAAGMLSRALRRRVKRLSENAERQGAQWAQTDADLKSTREFLRRLIETSPCVIFEQDPRTHEFLYVSPNVRAILGYAPETIMGSPGFWEERIHPEDRGQAPSAQSSRLELDYRFLHASGEYLWLHSVAGIEYDAGGQPISLLGHCLQITAPTHARAKQRD